MAINANDIKKHAHIKQEHSDRLKFLKEKTQDHDVDCLCADCTEFDCLEDKVLTEQEQGEPVAWYIREKDMLTRDANWVAEYPDMCEPLYTTPQPKQEHGKQDNYQGNDAAKAAHMIDLYTALGVRWGDDPFAVIAKMRSIAEAEKQERPTGPATSADRYFYEAGFEAGRLAGIKITLDEWAKSEPPVLAKQEQGEPKQEEYFSKAYRLANELRCHLAIAPAPQQRKPLNAEQIKGLVFDAGYIQAEETADFINGIRHCEAAYGITEEKNT